MTVLVTGGAGFIGSHFIEHLLAREDETAIVCLDNFNDYYDPAIKRANVRGFSADQRVTIVEQSFCDRAAMQTLLEEHEVRRIVHLGAYAGVRASVANPLIYEETNVRGTLAMLEAASAYNENTTRGIDRFLLISSSTVYGQDAVAPFQEDAELGIPLSPYGATKRAAELLGLSYHQLHGLPVVCLRPFSVYGPRTRPDLAMHIFAERILARHPITLFGDGTFRRDFTHVSDICTGLSAALAGENLAGQIINLGHHEPIAINELIAQLESALGRKATIEYREPVAADLPLTCADLTKARQLLGYQPKVDFADGLQDFVAWVLANAAKRK